MMKPNSANASCSILQDSSYRLPKLLKMNINIYDTKFLLRNLRRTFGSAGSLHSRRWCCSIRSSVGFGTIYIWFARWRWLKRHRSHYIICISNVEKMGQISMRLRAFEERGKDRAEEGDMSRKPISWISLP